jgi:hypothetical protein
MSGLGHQLPTISNIEDRLLAKYIGPSLVFPLKHSMRAATPATSRRSLIHLETD